MSIEQFVFVIGSRPTCNLCVIINFIVTNKLRSPYFLIWKILFSFLFLSLLIKKSTVSRGNKRYFLHNICNSIYIQCISTDKRVYLLFIIPRLLFLLFLLELLFHTSPSYTFLNSASHSFIAASIF